MSKRNDEKPLQKKLDDIHSRLMGDPTKDELNAMQLHLDAMERWTRLNEAEADHHHHDHMDDHDHTVAEMAE